MQRLIVLGFAQDRYPAALGRNAVFSAEDLAAIRECTGLPVETPAEELARRRARFRRQLGAVSEAVTFLVPRRDATGKAQSPSESLVFMQQLFAGPETADELVIELDAAEGRAQARQCGARGAGGACSRRASSWSRISSSGAICVALREDAEGKPKPESRRAVSRR